MGISELMGKSLRDSRKKLKKDDIRPSDGLSYAIKPLSCFVECVYENYKNNGEKQKEEIISYEEMYSWLEDNLEAYRKKVLSYQINKLCIKQDVPMSIVDKLREEYGNEVICPVLNILEEFTNKFNIDLNFLDKSYKNWLEKNEIDYYGNNYEKAITSHIVDESEQKAKEIIKQHIEK